MVPLCLQLKDVTPDQLMRFREVQYLVNNLPNDFTCHDVCAYLHQRFPSLLHFRGTFAGLDHSWLVFADRSETILDPYPWACASGPLLVTTEGMSPWARLYDGKEVVGG